MKQILIPTDFSIRSLHIVHDIVKRNEGRKISICILHMVQVPNELSELLFFKKSQLFNKVPVAFSEAMQMLRNRYASQLRLELRFSYGNHRKALDMTVESLAIEEIYWSGKHTYETPFTNSIDIIPMLPKCNVPVYLVGSKSAVQMGEDANMLSSLFSDDVSFTNIKKQSTL